MNIGQTRVKNISGVSLPIFQWGDSTQTWSKDALADYVTRMIS